MIAPGNSDVGCRRSHFRAIGFVLAIALVCVLRPIHAFAKDPSGEIAPLATAREQLKTDLESLAAKADELGMAREAAFTRGWILPALPKGIVLTIPAADPTKPAASATTRSQLWYAKFREHRAKYAVALYEEAKRKLVDAQPTAAYQFLHYALRENPENAEVRKLLGYRAAPAALPISSVGRPTIATVDHPRLGWKRGTYQRLTTDHFQITSSAPAGSIVRAAQQFEELHAIWKQACFGYWSSLEALQAREQGQTVSLGDLPGSSKPLQVVMFKNREEYLARLGEKTPQIELTTGIYFAEQQIAYIYADDPSAEVTWRHEIAHQLFQETPNRTLLAADQSSFAMVEAVAMYFESLARMDGYFTIGGVTADRLQFARYRALSGDYLLPIQQLIVKTRDDVQSDPEIRKLYSQSAAVAHFYFDGSSAADREAFLKYLALLYRGEITSSTQQPAFLLTPGGIDFRQQFTTFLDVTDAQLLACTDPSIVQNLSLGRTNVTDAGLAHLGQFKRLEWLDLSLTKVSDNGLAQVDQLAKLHQLFLEGTGVTSASIPAIARLRSLEELDLSKLKIADDDLAKIATLKQLKVLYLVGTPITDAGLAKLVSLQQLELIDLRGTRVTAAAVEQLKSRIGSLKSVFVDSTASANSQ